MMMALANSLINNYLPLSRFWFFQIMAELWFEKFYPINYFLRMSRYCKRISADHSIFKCNQYKCISSTRNVTSTKYLFQRSEKKLEFKLNFKILPISGQLDNLTKNADVRIII